MVCPFSVKHKQVTACKSVYVGFLPVRFVMMKKRLQFLNFILLQNYNGGGSKVLHIKIWGAARRGEECCIVMNVFWGALE